jgi:DMSO/TMAO reductase YedYZ molybdopterin-dependent catalytic subunit
MAGPSPTAGDAPAAAASARGAAGVTGADGRITVEERPYNAETPLWALGTLPTPAGLVYVRTHFDLPEHLAAPDFRAAWRLRVDGAVQHPLDLGLADLQALEPRRIPVTMECAGNGRALMTPPPPGTPWRLGAVSTVTFTGTPLAGLLARAGVRPGAVEVLAEGADRGEVARGRVEPFRRSLPLAAATHPDTLLAWAMDDRPLPPLHGAPLRLVVPRWYGMASVKWLVRLTVLEEPFAGFFQRERYVYEDEEGTPQGTPVTTIRVRAVIADPPDGARLPAGPLTIRGIAWSGDGPIATVRVSTDGGAHWQEAALEESLSPYAAHPWHLTWDPPGPGRYTIVARAIDTLGNAQPLAPRWNRHGYGNNVAHTVHVEVTASPPPQPGREPGDAGEGGEHGRPGA